MEKHAEIILKGNYEKKIQKNFEQQLRKFWSNVSRFSIFGKILDKMYKKNHRRKLSELLKTF